LRCPQPGHLARKEVTIGPRWGGELRTPARPYRDGRLFLAGLTIVLPGAVWQAGATACGFSSNLDKSCTSDDHEVTVRSRVAAPGCHFTETTSWGGGSKKTSLAVSSKTTAGSCKSAGASYTEYAP
jgi:hypothetical protein